MSLPILHILHLSRRIDRLQQLIKQLEWNNVTAQFWDGIDDPNNVKQAITKSYKKIIQHAKDKNYSEISLAEDDLCFTHKDSYKYFHETTPEDYDLYVGLIYAGTVEDNRILNGMSGTMTLWKCHNRFYDHILNLPDDCHIDRECGSTAFKNKYYVCPEFCCYQSGGYSDNLRMHMTYEPYIIGKKMYGVD